MAKNKQLREELEQNEIVLQVFPLDDLIQEWNRRKGARPQVTTRYQAQKKAAGFVSPAKDSMTAFRICKDLGLNGRYVLKTVGDKQYVIFKGYPGLRTIFNAPRYLSTNKKIIKMAIGKAGIKSSVKGGAILTIVLFTSINLLDYILNDQATLSKLVGTIASDLIKVGISSILATIAGIAVGGTGAVVAGPLIVAIGVGIAVGWGLDSIDKQYGLTDKLVAHIDRFGRAFAEKSTELENKLGRTLHEAERALIYRAIGFDIDNPFGSRRLFR